MNKMLRTLYVLSILLLGFSILAAEKKDSNLRPGTALKNDSIRTEPFTDAREIATIEKGKPVMILDRKGGWYKISSAKGKGWVRMLSIRTSKDASRRISHKGILELASGRTGTGTVILTTGIRGLDEESLQTARFNAQQLSKLESFIVNRIQARQFAAAGKLRTRTIPYLKEGKSK
jgi:uncharacterized protein YraI